MQTLAVQGSQTLQPKPTQRCVCRGMEPLQMQHIPILPETAGQMHFVLVTPEFEAPTAEMRAALPASVPFETAVHNSGRAGLLVAGILTGAPASPGASELINPIRGKPADVLL